MQPNSSAFRHIARRTLIASLLVACFTTAQAAEPVKIDIAAQPLASALAKFAEQSGVKAVYPAELLAGKKAPHVEGSLTARQALDKLLAGSGLRYQFVGADAVKIEAVPVEHETKLKEIVVMAATRTSNPVEKVAASVSVVTQEDFDEQQAATVSAVLKKLPNVEFGGGPRVNGEIPTIRGVSGPSITLLVDGARQNDSTSPRESLNKPPQNSAAN